MKKYILLLLLGVSVFANAKIMLSDSCRISLLTCEPSREVYARFGHTAIRVCDSINDIDYVYNYGIFDFSTKFFIARFVQGATDYMLQPVEMDYFLDSYIQRQSTVYEQVLDLSKNEKQKLYDALEENYLPENRVYRYNFVYDNCATRPFDKIWYCLNETPIITYSGKQTTFRTIIDEFVGRNNWLSFGIDIVIGSEADKPLNPLAPYAFPKYTMEIINSITLQKDTVQYPLVSDSHLLCVFPRVEIPENYPTSPVNISILLLVAVAALSYFLYKKGKYAAWLDFILFLTCGLIGTVVFYLMFISYHPIVHQNYNLLWLNPLQLFFAFLLLKKSWRSWLKYFAAFNAFTTMLAIMVYITGLQIMSAAFLPLMAMMIIRSLLFYQQSKIQQIR